MSGPFVGEIRMFAGNFAPAGWAFCAGQLMPISENETLFNLIGTTYGGDGQETFALPSLQGRVPMHQGNGVQIAELAGTETVTLTTQQIPSHNHLMNAGGLATVVPPAGALLGQPTGQSSGFQTYADPAGAPLVNLASNMLQPSGSSQPHDNVQPFLCVSFIISLFGVFPSQT
jgi:microcystin-dependent protein